MEAEQEAAFQQQLQNEEEIELKKKIALYYHSLFQGCLSQWFVLMQQENYQKLSKRQYLDLNVRIQKSLILDFDLPSAKQSAIEDWKIDVEREMVDKKEGSVGEEIKNEIETPNNDDNPNIIQGVVTTNSAEIQPGLEGIKETDDE